MLNLAMGSYRNVDGRSCIATASGAVGHAVYGPYEQRQPGRYAARFAIAPIDDVIAPPHDADALCAVVDVSANFGQIMLGRKEITASQLNHGSLAIDIEFSLSCAMALEYRVYSTGFVPLLIEETCRILPAATKDVAEHLAYVKSEVVRVEDALRDGSSDGGYLGLAPDRYISRFFEHQPENELYEAMYGGSEPLRSVPGHVGMGSTLCRQLHFSLDEYRWWAGKMGRRPRLHRKDWEWFYIAQSLLEAGMLRPGRKGLVFAVGREPLPAVFAAFGCDILATDQAAEQAVQSGWAASNQHSLQVDSLFNAAICPAEQFHAHVSFQSMDMNAIPENHKGLYDFCWSSCSLEHLGSLEHGMRFVEDSVATLKPGGIAVHTTEFNLSSDDETIETPSLSIYRKRDIAQLIARLEDAGHEVAPFDWTMGGGFAETVIDLPPYKQSPHLRVKVGEFAVTSVGMVIRRRAA